MVVKLTKEQVDFLMLIVCRASILGNDAEIIVGLKQALAKVEPEQENG